MTGRLTHKQRVLHLLSDGRPHSHLELYQLGCVAHSRVSDLRKDGYEIEQRREGDLYLYTLLGAPAGNGLLAGAPSSVGEGSGAGGDHGGAVALASGQLSFGVAA